MIKKDLEFRIAGLVKEEERLKDHCVFLKGKLEAEVVECDKIRRKHDLLYEQSQLNQMERQTAFISSLNIINYLTKWAEFDESSH